MQSVFTAFVAAAIDAVMGMIIAWVLVDMIFRKSDHGWHHRTSICTADRSCRIALTHLTTTEGWVGAFFQKFGIKIAYTRLGIIVALVFIGIPFVVRAVQPFWKK